MLPVFCVFCSMPSGDRFCCSVEASIYLISVQACSNSILCSHFIDRCRSRREVAKRAEYGSSLPTVALSTHLHTSIPHPSYRYALLSAYSEGWNADVNVCCLNLSTYTILANFLLLVIVATLFLPLSRVFRAE